MRVLKQLVFNFVCEHNIQCTHILNYGSMYTQIFTEIHAKPFEFFQEFGHQTKKIYESF